jgi:hypothetical protein
VQKYVQRKSPFVLKRRVNLSKLFYVACVIMASVIFYNSFFKLDKQPSDGTFVTQGLSKT